MQNVWQWDSIDIYMTIILCKTLPQVQSISWYFIWFFYKIVTLLLKLFVCGFVYLWWSCFCQILLFLQKDKINKILHICIYSGDQNMFFLINHYICNYWIAAALKAVCANYLNTVIITLSKDYFNYIGYLILLLYLISRLSIFKHYS